eukprot:CAMPEP_0170285964 /NCGR_PEP_ID=MMETSP0116_2-20130129/43036_1 /TAXON_ID=400756 /ORGANISM="Durinskia baltica, Strain CSIRO CS-38" /LENGTH=317 /DNA_ID=CAMNT_0010537375 /DNA_START=40 /DNA_END=993 /DNA_ORIENTATION=-
MSAATFPAGSAEAFMCVVVAAAILSAELRRRAAIGTEQSLWPGAAWARRSCKRLLAECAPEALGLLACFSVAAILRARGDEEDLAGLEAWEKIKSEWPLLVTADTLLALQAMLRLVIFASVALRAGRASNSPLADEAAALWLFASMARAALVARSDAYMLEGPVGQHLPTFCEVALVPLLLLLGRRALWRAPLTLSAAVASAGCLASRHHLALAETWDADAIFIAAELLEVLAALAFLARTMCMEDRPRDMSAHLVCILLPAQQALSAYYWLEAFPFSEPLVRAGLPFQVLQVGGCVQLGVFLGAAALQFAEVVDGR